jgi:hypothetical protein
MVDVVQKLASGVEFNWLDTTEKFVNDDLLHSLKEQVSGVNIKSQMIERGKASEKLWQSELYYLTRIICGFFSNFWSHKDTFYAYSYLFNDLEGNETFTLLFLHWDQYFLV